MRNEFDVVVVGAGVGGGLPAAAYLQRAGASVAVVEQREETAAFFSSYERAPGVRFDVAPVNFSCMSPALVDLDLASYGYEIEYPDVLFSSLDGAGRAITFFADPDRTHAELARFSKRDADAVAGLLGGLAGRAREILAAAFFTPAPDLDRAVALTADAVGLSREELAALSATDLLERRVESEGIRIALMALPAVNLFGELLAPGQGALSLLWGFLLRTCHVRAGAGALAQALERCFLDAGGTLLCGAAARGLVRDDDGVCRGVEVELGTRRELLVARQAVVSNLGAPLTAELLGEELRPDWRSAGRTVFTADLVLDRPLRWPAGELERSPRVYLLWRTWDECVAWLRAAREEREEVFAGHLELTQFHVVYGSGPGGTPLRVRFGTGPFVDDDWGQRAERHEELLRDRIAALDPDVTIRSVDLATPLEYWRMNAAATHGNPVGGDFVEGQWLGERLPYRTSVPGLYASNSVWPTSLSWMATGYNAAVAVAEDLGIRDQPWWKAPPLPEDVQPR